MSKVRSYWALSDEERAKAERLAEGWDRARVLFPNKSTGMVLVLSNGWPVKEERRIALTGVLRGSNLRKKGGAAATEVRDSKSSKTTKPLVLLFADSLKDYLHYRSKINSKFYRATYISSDTQLGTKEPGSIVWNCSKERSFGPAMRAYLHGQGHTEVYTCEKGRLSTVPFLTSDKVVDVITNLAKLRQNQVDQSDQFFWAYGKHEGYNFALHIWKDESK
jgi:hypothetical protein